MAGASLTHIEKVPLSALGLSAKRPTTLCGKRVVVHHTSCQPCNVDCLECLTIYLVWMARGLDLEPTNEWLKHRDEAFDRIRQLFLN